MTEHIITVSDEVEKALAKKAQDDGISTAALIQKQLEYYIGCALCKHFDPNHAINTPKLSIEERLEVYAEGVNNDESAARAKVTEILNNR